MRIAVYLNDEQKPAEFFDPGSVCLFEEHDSAWKQVAQYPLHVARTMSLSEMKTEFTQAMEAVRECGDFIVCEQRGIFRVFLEDLGFRVWTSTGNPEEQLQEIACLDSCSSEECGPVIYPRPVEGEEDGVYSVNLIELMHQGVPLISREILIPFFETTSFTRLEITCDHLPRWFEFELPQLSLRLESTKKISGSSDIVAVVVPEVGERTCPRGRTRRSCGCSCGG